MPVLQTTSTAFPEPMPLRPTSKPQLHAKRSKNARGEAHGRAMGARTQPQPAGRFCPPIESRGEPQSQCRCGRGEPSPGEISAEASPVPMQMWRG